MDEARSQAGEDFANGQLIELNEWHAGSVHLFFIHCALAHGAFPS